MILDVQMGYVFFIRVAPVALFNYIKMIAALIMEGFFYLFNSFNNM